MKKILFLALVLVFVFAVAATAFAADPGNLSFYDMPGGSPYVPVTVTIDHVLQVTAPSSFALPEVTTPGQACSANGVVTVNSNDSFMELAALQPKLLPAGVTGPGGMNWSYLQATDDDGTYGLNPTITHSALDIDNAPAQSGWSDTITMSLATDWQSHPGNYSGSVIIAVSQL